MPSNTNVIQPWLRSRAWGLFLIVLAWQGPVPVLHAHGTFGSSNLPSVELASHLLERHADDHSAGATFIDWHWHWMMPDDLRITNTQSSRSSSSGEQEANCELQPIMEVQGIVFDLQQPSSFDEIFFKRLDFWQRQTLRRHDFPTFFLMTFGTDRSLPERLSIYRC